MTNFDLQNQIKDNMAHCLAAAGRGDLAKAETYLGYANKLTLTLFGKQEAEKQDPDGCPWSESSGCWNCTKLHCMFNGES